MGFFKNFTDKIRKAKEEKSSQAFVTKVKKDKDGFPVDVYGDSFVEVNAEEKPKNNDKD